MVAILMLMLASAGAADLDPALEAKAKQLENQLIAPCCWRAPVSEHYSGAADEVRQQVRALLAEGKTEDEVLQSFVAKYGERILSSPPATGFNLMSWVLPFAALALGGLGILVFVRNHSRPAAAAPSPSPSPSPQGEPPSEDQRYLKMLENELKEV